MIENTKFILQIILQCSGKSVHRVRVTNFIMQKITPGGHYFGTVSGIARELHIGRRSVRSVVDELMARHICEKLERGLYRFTTDHSEPQPIDNPKNCN